MELYPPTSLQKLQFDKVLSWIKERCVSELGKKASDAIEVLNDLDSVKTALQEVSEFKTLIKTDQAFPIYEYPDLNEDLNYLEKENSVFSENQLFELLLFLNSIREIYSYFRKRQVKYPALNATVSKTEFDPVILKQISIVISEDGTIRNGISSALDRIRKDIRGKEKELDKKFHDILAFAQAHDWLASGAESIKNGRRVLMVQSEFKRRIKGIIHDESATGKTVFIEPEQTIEISNEWFELKQEEKREIYKILRETTELIRPHCTIIRAYQKLGAFVDMTRSKALIAITLNAEHPHLSAKPVIKIIDGRHPVLLEHNQRLNKPTIPLTVLLNQEFRILLISGPNAGGKSVALKTIGLLQCMLQAGLLVPVNPDSEMTVFQKIFVELGDEQSIENDLSTYSSHLSHMKYFVENSDERTLFLIDEFGTGTDPKFGGAIAEAILEQLIEKRAFGVVTTHYSNLKIFAGQAAGILNGSMLFDKANAKPLFELKTGQPGSSHAFEIAEKIGMPKSIIDSAREKSGREFENLDSLLAETETRQHWLNIREKKSIEKEKNLDNLIETYTGLKEDLESNKKRLLLDAKRKAMETVENSRREMEAVIREAKESAKKNKTPKSIEAKTKLSDVQHKLKSEISEISASLKKTKENKPEIKAGSLVRLADREGTGVVDEIRKDKALVSFGHVRTLIPISELESVDPGKDLAKKLSKSTFNTSSMDFSPQIDLRGKRTDEAIEMVEKQLDKAVLLGFNSLRILHGKGDGILRKAIRSLLKKYDIVKDVQSESPDLGGEGVTLVELK